MAKDREDRLDPTQPTLIVQHGNTPRKYRPLDQEATVLGRAPGCDLPLMAPEVAPVHCVIVRAADGWRVRDCTGRGATHLNGRSVRDETLADEDVLQIGSFSFALHLPPGPPRPAVAPASPDGRHDKEQDEERLAARQEDLDRQAEELETLRNELDARLAELRQARQDLAEESAAVQKRREQAEKELAERRACSDAALRASLEAYQARRREAEEAHARTLAEQERAHREAVRGDARRLEIRAAELQHYTAHLRRRDGALRQENERLREALAEREAALAAAREEARRPSPYELDERRSLEEEIAGLHARCAEMESAAREAELHIARGRERIVRGREGLEQLRRGSRPAEAPSPTQDTVVDMPSPLHPFPRPDAAVEQLVH